MSQEREQDTKTTRSEEWPSVSENGRGGLMMIAMAFITCSVIILMAIISDGDSFYANDGK